MGWRQGLKSLGNWFASLPSPLPTAHPFAFCLMLPTGKPAQLSLNKSPYLSLSVRLICQCQFAFSEQKLTVLVTWDMFPGPCFLCKLKFQEWWLFTFWFIFLDADRYYACLSSDTCSKMRGIKEGTRTRWIWSLELRWCILMAIKLGM